ncbi:MAG TPA: DUF924 family protein [Kofleriaceae bacterium]|nr:DUF924 family protein [Kofleriaceae bacterium]
MSALPPPGDVLAFWFSDQARPMWFSVRAAFDDEIRARFGALAAAAAAGELDGWAATGDGALALVIALDQFPRNLHRGTPQAFACDARAREIASGAIDRGLDLRVALERRAFVYLPFEHSELLADQDRSVALFEAWAAEHPAEQRAAADDTMSYAVRHREIIERFGRFPHRNAVLGRTSTPEEIAFLAEPRSSF